MEKTEWAKFVRRADLGIDVLHARYVTHRYETHSHNYFVLGTVDEGAADFATGKSRTVAPASTAMISNAGEPHDGHSHGGDGYTYRMVYAERHVVNSIAQEHSAGVRLVVSDIDQLQVKRTVAMYGAFQVASDQAHSQQVDVFAPCAFGGILNTATIGEIQAPIVAGAANNQLATDVDGVELAARNIVYCPDYVINAGGIRSTEIQGLAFNHDSALRRVEGIADVPGTIIEKSKSSGRPTAVIADEMAVHRICNQT